MTQTQRAVDTDVWTDAQHELLGHLADMVVPRGDEMPSATNVEVHTVGAERVARLRPDLVAPVTHLLNEAALNPPPNLVALMADYPGHFPAFAELVAGAYYLDTRVAELIGYRARRAIPVGDLTGQDAELVELLRPVTTRGNTWRTTPLQ